MPEGKGEAVLARSPGLGRGFVLSGPPEGRLYVRPISLIHGAEARAALEVGAALPLAGGTLAFTRCEVLQRGERGVECAFVTVFALREWARKAGSTIEHHVSSLLDALSAPRADFAGLSLDRPRLMGIVNATPDSFSDGGDHAGAEGAIAHALALAEAGADILDVGGESTRPGAEPVAAEEELRRVAPVLDGLAAALPGTVVSIDTRHAAVMRAALDARARVINDVTALAGDSLSLALVAERRAATVLMHMPGTPQTMNQAPHYAFAPLDVYDALAARVEACLAAGIPRARIAVDPGLGFGKHTSHNLEILERLSLFHGLGCAVMIGASRKLLIGISPKSVPPKARLGASLAAGFAALDEGAQLLRVHDVAATLQAVNVWRALRGNY